jgi:hypothetical protein
MLNPLLKFRYSISKTPLRRPWVWYQHRGLNSNDEFLASYPRSGSTWLRFVLLEILTRNPAGFENVNQIIPELRRHRGVLSVLPRGGRFIKTHEPYCNLYKRAVYLVRDVRDVVLSNYVRDEEQGFAQYFSNGKGFEGYLQSYLRGKAIRYGSWQNHVTTWLDSPLAKSGDLLLIKYEEMRRNTDAILAKTLNFLGIDADGERIRTAIENNSLSRMRAKEDGSRGASPKEATGRVLLKGHKGGTEDGRFVRTGSVGGWRQRLSEAQVALIEEYCGEALARLGYAVGAAAVESDGAMMRVSTGT